MKRKFLLTLLLCAFISSLTVGLTACKQPANGKSAYELYVDSYILATGSDAGVMSEAEWLLSLKGEQGAQGSQGAQGTQGDKGEDGANGLSAYEIYKKHTKDDPVLTEEQWLESLKGDKGEDGADGLSAYEIYKKYTDDDPVLTEEQWLESLKGGNGEGFEESNPQGLAFYLQDDGTLAVGAGQALLLSEITVPASFNGKAVTCVYDFSGCKNLIKINLPAGIVTICDNAFENCLKLNEIYIGENKLNGFSFNNAFFAYDSDISIGANAFVNTDIMSVSIADSSDNDTKVALTVKNRLPDVTEIKVSSALNSSTDIRFNNTVNLNDAEETYEVDFGTYGLFKDIDIELYKGAQKYLSIENAGGVAVTADEYNFAPLNASYPVLVFSLQIDTITDNGQIPTFVYLERVAQYNWNQLPVGVQCMPYITRNQATVSSDFHGLRAGMAQYIKELYELNPDSKFNLYVVDNYGELILQMLVANRIPEAQWTATMLSDGAGTAGYLSSTYGVDNPTGKYNDMKEEWLIVKNSVYSAGSYDNKQVASQLKYLAGSNEYSILARYAYVMAKEQSNISWVVNRLRATENLVAINQKDPDFVNGILAVVQQVYTNNLLAALTDEQAENFKQLYKFNGDMFEEAEKQGKDVIIILGTSWNGENGNLYDNIKVLVELYGTENYVYYYKGHPGYPTSQYAGRQEYFSMLADEGYEIYELDNAIAAEIILFFKPDIYMAGYSTSTFDSVESHEKALLLFGSKTAFAAQTYSKYFDVFASVITDKTAYAGITLNDAHKYYVIEYNNTEEYASQTENYNKHEIAIYDTTEKTFRYYKLNEGLYSEVDKDGVPVANQ